MKDTQPLSELQVKEHEAGKLSARGSHLCKGTLKVLKTGACKRELNNTPKFPLKQSIRAEKN